MEYAKCPACRSPALSDYEHKYACGSTGPYAGGRIELERTDACLEIEKLRGIADLAVMFCDSTSQSENWRVSTLLSDALAAIGMYPEDWRRIKKPAHDAHH
jgi:hypothetical protein